MSNFSAVKKTGKLTRTDMHSPIWHGWLNSNDRVLIVGPVRWHDSPGYCDQDLPAPTRLRSGDQHHMRLSMSPRLRIGLRSFCSWHWCKIYWQHCRSAIANRKALIAGFHFHLRSQAIQQLHPRLVTATAKKKKFEIITALMCALFASPRARSPYWKKSDSLTYGAAHCSNAYYYGAGRGSSHRADSRGWRLDTCKSTSLRGPRWPWESSLCLESEGQVYADNYNWSMVILCRGWVSWIHTTVEVVVRIGTF